LLIHQVSLLTIFFSAFLGCARQSLEYLVD
jgi:hypothetical protein